MYKMFQGETALDCRQGHLSPALVCYSGLLSNTCVMLSGTVSQTQARLSLKKTSSAGQQVLFQNLNIQYSVVQKSWSNSHFFIFCFQGARRSSNFLKWSLNINCFPGFMKVFYCFSLDIVCFSIHFHSSPCVHHFQRFCLFFLRHLTLFESFKHKNEQERHLYQGTNCCTLDNLAKRNI